MSHYFLDIFLSNRIYEDNKRLLYATKFWDNLLYSHSYRNSIYSAKESCEARFLSDISVDVARTLSRPMRKIIF